MLRYATTAPFGGRPPRFGNSAALAHKKPFTLAGGGVFLLLEITHVYGVATGVSSSPGSKASELRGNDSVSPRLPVVL